MGLDKLVVMNRFCFAVVLGWLLLAAATSDAEEQPVSIIAFPFAPYINGDQTGLAEQIVAAALGSQGLESQFIYMPLARANQVFAEGSYDVIITTCEDSDLAEPFRVDFIYGRSSFHYLRERFPDFKLIPGQQFQHLKVGVVRGSIWHRRFQRTYPQLFDLANVNRLMTSLTHKRVDFALVLELAARLELKQNFASDQSQIAVAKYHDLLGQLCFTPNERGLRLASVARNGVAQLIESGEYLKLLESFYGKDEVPSWLLDKVNTLLASPLKNKT